MQNPIAEQKRRELRARRATKQVLARLRDVEGLNAVEADANVLPLAIPAWSAFALQSTPVASRIPFSTRRDLRDAWFAEQRRDCRIENDRFFVLTGGASWIEGSIRDSISWTRLWEALPVRDFLLLGSPSQAQVLGLSEEEHDFLAIKLTRETCRTPPSTPPT